MSQFIKSYYNTISKKKLLMKFHSHTYKNQWAIYPLPFAYIYFETCHPDSHVSFWKNEICGAYLSFNWIKWTWNVGLFKSLK
jgi:hypothetical protein